MSTPGSSAGSRVERDVRRVHDAIHVDVAGQALAAEVGDDRRVVGVEDDRLARILDPVAVEVGELVLRAQGVAEDVGRDLADVVGDEAGEPGQAVLAGVVLAVRPTVTSAKTCALMVAVGRGTGWRGTLDQAR